METSAERAARPRSSPETTLGGELRSAIDAVGRLVRDHIDLAKLEIREEAKKASIDVGLGLAAIPFGLAALIMLDVALAIGLSSWVHGAWAFLIVGGLNLIIGGGLGTFSAARLSRKRRLEALEAELDNNRSFAAQLRSRLRAGRLR
ncbi:phage holin family protein [Vulgatibacter incomptus]|uniref:Integral membrane protein n=1 Tax=Vulgatibacter incomptus TaxID=1391653 RepID=A0A0K1PEC5_9BACT|nr:phage holin family protein [Vulgatibacter incomptus]AKU91756.1 hypothetical protein AKJ08_2143 [Vulgatibacter incomptus]